MPTKEIPFFISAYGPKQKSPTYFTAPSRTKQAHKAECDINQILARYKKTGVLEFAQRREPQYGDVTAVDFQEAQLLVARAKGLFADMPAHLRHRFHNDPAQFLAFVNDERNREEAQALGLLKMKPEATEAPARAPQEPQANPPAPQATPPAATA